MLITTTNPLPGTIKDPRYPESDGQPMGETQFHILAIMHLYEALDYFFRNHADVYVAVDMFMYYEQGNPSACKAPDVFVAKGVQGKHSRRSFRIWEEGVAPTVIFEVTSDKSRYEDQEAKPRVYAALGVSEYFVFDPDSNHRNPTLEGFRLDGGVYQPLPLDEAGRLKSQELGLALESERPLLRLIDLRTGRRIMTYSEKADEADAERARANIELARANAEFARTAELEAELARLRALPNRPQPPN